MNGVRYAAELQLDFYDAVYATPAVADQYPNGALSLSIMINVAGADNPYFTPITATIQVSVGMVVMRMMIMKTLLPSA